MKNKNATQLLRNPVLNHIQINEKVQMLLTDDFTLLTKVTKVCPQEDIIKFVLKKYRPLYSFFLLQNIRQHYYTI